MTTAAAATAVANAPERKAAARAAETITDAKLQQLQYL
jgi:hypothetical protein